MTSPRSGTAAGASVQSGGFAISESRVLTDRRRLSLRGPGNPHIRSFHFTNPTSDSCGGVRARSSDAAAVPGSPRSSLRGLPAGKLVETFRRAGRKSQGSLAWPDHQDRQSGGTAKPRLSFDDSVLSIDSDEEISSPKQTITRAEAVSLAAVVAAGAELEAVSDNHRGNPGGSRSTRTVDESCEEAPGFRFSAVSVQLPDSHWRDGLSPRTAERGASRVFPCHLITPRAVSGASVTAPVSGFSVGSAWETGSMSSTAMSHVATMQEMRNAPASLAASPLMSPGSSPRASSPRAFSPRGSSPRCSPRSSRRSSVPSKLGTFSNVTRSDPCSSSASVGGITAISSILVPTPVAATKGKKDLAAAAGINSSAVAATPSSATSPAAVAASKGKREVVASASGSLTLTRAGPGTLLAAAPTLGGKPSSSAAERLSALRGKLERSLRTAEDGLSTDLQQLDRRLASHHRKPSDASVATMES